MNEEKFDSEVASSLGRARAYRYRVINSKQCKILQGMTAS